MNVRTKRFRKEQNAPHWLYERQTHMDKKRTDAAVRATRCGQRDGQWTGGWTGIDILCAAIL